MIEATLRSGDDVAPKLLGVWRFHALPNPGDHIHIPNERGSMDILRVLFVEHTPGRVAHARFGDDDPQTWIKIERIGSYGD